VLPLHTNAYINTHKRRGTSTQVVDEHSRCRETRLFQLVSIMRVSISAVRKDEHLQAQWSTSEELHVAHHARQQIAVQRADNLNATLRDLSTE
jgi:hypothetical protein